MTGTRTYLKGEARTTAIAQAKDLYEQGCTVRSVAQRMGRSYGGAHTLLVAGGVTFRTGRRGPRKAAG